MRWDTTFLVTFIVRPLSIVKKNNLIIPEVKKCKISTRIDHAVNIQHFVDTKEEELRISSLMLIKLKALII